MGAGLLQGSRSLMVRASTAKVGGLGFNPKWLPRHFFSVCFCADLPPVACHQLLPPAVWLRITSITKLYLFTDF